MFSLIAVQALLLAAIHAGWKALKQAKPASSVRLLMVMAAVAAMVYVISSLHGISRFWISAAVTAHITVLASALLSLRWQLSVANVLASGLAFLLTLPLFASYVLPQQTGPVTGAEQPVNEVHIALSIAAFSLFTLAALQSLVVTWLSARLHRRLAAYQGAGALESNEKAWACLLRLAWVAVSAALLSGIPGVYDVFDQHLSHKIFFALLAWLLLSILLLGRQLRGWREKTAARWVWWGWLALLVGWQGSKLVLNNLIAT